MGIGVVATGIELREPRSALQNALNYTRFEAATKAKVARANTAPPGSAGATGASSPANGSADGSLELAPPEQYAHSYSEAHPAWAQHDVCRQLVRHPTFTLPVAGNPEQDGGASSVDFRSFTLALGSSGENKVTSVVAFSDDAARDDFLEHADEFLQPGEAKDGIAAIALSGVALSGLVLPALPGGLCLSIDVGAKETLATVAPGQFPRIAGALHAYGAESALRSLELLEDGVEAAEADKASGAAEFMARMPSPDPAWLKSLGDKLSPSKFEPDRLEVAARAMMLPAYFVLQERSAGKEGRPLRFSDLKFGSEQRLPAPTDFDAQDAVLVFSDVELALRFVLHASFAYDLQHEVVVNSLAPGDLWTKVRDGGSGAAVDFMPTEPADQWQTAAGRVSKHLAGAGGVYVPPGAWWFGMLD